MNYQKVCDPGPSVLEIAIVLLAFSIVMLPRLRSQGFILSQRLLSARRA
jgi:hypothetical protein